MGRSTAVLTVLMGLLVAGMTFSTAFAGTKSSPDITDAEGDWQVAPDPTGVGGETDSPVADSIDITAVWWTFTSKSNLEVGVEVVNLPDQNASGDTGSLSYIFAFTFSRQALPGSPAENRSVDVTIDTNLNPDHTPSCDPGENASKDFEEETLRCNLPSSEVAPEHEGNTTFYDGDAIISGSLNSEGTADGTFTYNDSASGIQDDIVVQGIQEPPAGTDDGNGTDGDGGGGGDGDGGADGEETPGFGVLGAAGAMAVVAALAARRRD